MSNCDLRPVELAGFCPTIARGDVAIRDPLKQLQTYP
jgi:hypothetical protein